MILSHDKQFIFLKTRKTAGTSVEMALSDHCGPMDIITPIALEDERARMKKSQMPRNYQVVWPYGPKRAANLAKKEDLDKEKYTQLISAGRVMHRFHNHATATEVLSLSGADIWNRYFKFTIERNPWDFQVSRFFWRQKTVKGFNLDFDAFLRQNDLPTNWDVYTIDDKIVVDKVVLFEDLTMGLASLKEQLGFDISEGLPHAKGNTGRKKRDYKDFYSENQRKLVAKQFEKVIDTFKYTF